MNRRMRRAALRRKGPLAGKVCEHGNFKKTDGNGNPMCPYGCGFNDRKPGFATVTQDDIKNSTDGSGL